MGTETTEAAAALSGGGCEIDIEVVRSGFAHWCCGCQEEPCSGAWGSLGQASFLLLWEASQMLQSRVSPQGLHQSQTEPW